MFAFKGHMYHLTLCQYNSMNAVFLHIEKGRFRPIYQYFIELQLFLHPTFLSNQEFVLLLSVKKPRYDDRLLL